MIRKFKFNPFFCGFLLFSVGCARSSLDKLFADYQAHDAHYQEQIAQGFYDPDARLKAADFYYRFNDYAEVVRILKDEPRPQPLLAKSYARLKEYTAALEVFEQLPEGSEGEYLYLYALSAQEKNLFPKAAKLYARVKGNYRDKAMDKLKSLGIKIEQGVPAGITQLLSENKDFIASIKEEEAVIVLADEAIEVGADNTSCSSVHVVEQVLKEKGKDIGEVQISYDSTYERVELEYARTITPDGNVIYAGAENIRDVSKYLNFPLYSNAKAFIISMPSVEVGAIIEYKAKIYSSKLVNGDDFNFMYRLRDYFPIAHQKFRLVVPAARAVNFDFLNSEYAREYGLEPKVDETVSTKVYSWDFKRVAPIIPEDKMPPLPEINPAVNISSFRSWQEIYEWWHGLFADKIALPPELKDFLDTLLKGCGDDLEKIKKIHEFCAQNIRYVGAEYGESGYEPHMAEAIFWNRYGDCKDQATLLVALLRAAGFEAYPVLIPTRSSYDIAADFPSINFNHAIACIKWQGNFVFMDPTASTTAFFDLPLGDQDRTVMIFKEDGYEVTKTALLANNQVVYNMHVKIDTDQTARVDREVVTSGNFSSAQRYFLKYTHPQKIKETLQDKMKAISPLARLITYEIKGVDTLSQVPFLAYSFEARKFLNPAHNLRLIPYLSDIDLDVSYIARDERNFPIEFAGLFKQACKVNIELPPNLKVRYLPQNEHLENDWFEFSARYSREKNYIDFSQDFVIKKRFVPRDEYKKFKDDLETVFYLLREEIILEKL